MDTSMANDNKRDRYLKFFNMAYDMTGDVDEARQMTSQMAQESAGFKRFDESAHYSVKAMRRMFKKARSMSDEELKKISPKYKKGGTKKKFFDTFYGDRLGNEGEGYKYRGRGAIQVTGKDNYDRLNIDPDELENPMSDEQAFDLSARWWNENVGAHGKSKEEISKIVNPGEESHKRQQRYDRYAKTDELIGDFMDAIKQRQKTKALNKEDMMNSLYPKVR